MMTASIFARPILQAPDLVISVDAYVAHLAGALAKPVGLMLSLTSDWRWLQACGDNPWYPMMRRSSVQTHPQQRAGHDPPSDPSSRRYRLEYPTGKRSSELRGCYGIRERSPVTGRDISRELGLPYICGDGIDMTHRAG